MYKWLRCILLFSQPTLEIIYTCVDSTVLAEGITYFYSHLRRLGLSANQSSGTQFLPKPVHGINDPVTSVALGQDHTIAVTSAGAVFTWGSNQHGQLGYSLDLLIHKDNVQKVPRKIISTLKRIDVLGIAASSIHSVCFSVEDLYTWGLDRGQLGYSSGDDGPIQYTPKKVATLPSPVEMVTAIDNATICLLKNKVVLIFANGGYFRVKYSPFDFQSLTIVFH
jgi:inhibitor of Bruton tyrosine kinase